MNGQAVKCDNCGKIEFFVTESFASDPVQPDGWYILRRGRKLPVKDFCSTKCVQWYAKSGDLGVERQVTTVGLGEEKVRRGQD